MKIFVNMDGVCQIWNKDNFSMLAIQLLRCPNFRADFFSIRESSLLSWFGFRVLTNF